VRAISRHTRERQLLKGLTAADKRTLNELLQKLLDSLAAAGHDQPG
jgi:hypothetical protein